MNSSIHTYKNSCTIEEKFDLQNITPFAGANIIVDSIRKLGIDRSLDSLTVKKAPWASYSTSTELQIIMTAYMLGLERIEHTQTMECDPFLTQKFGLVLEEDGVGYTIKLKASKRVKEHLMETHLFRRLFYY